MIDQFFFILLIFGKSEGVRTTMLGLYEAEGGEGVRNKEDLYVGFKMEKKRSHEILSRFVIR